MKTNKCSVCGSTKRVFFTKSYGDYLCGNHRNHMNRNGHILARTRHTPNEIVIKEDHAEIIIYTLRHEEKGRALIDIEDIDLVKNYKWAIDGNNAVHNGEVGYLHRLVLGATDPNKEVDHENRNTWDCQKHNLREISHSLNILNGKLRTNNTSGANGVYWSRGQWHATIKINYKKIKIGKYDNKQNAIDARLKAEQELIPINIYPR